MENNLEILKLHKNREIMYNMLSRLYLLEVDSELLLALNKADFPAGELEPKIAEGFNKIKTFINTPYDNIIDELAVDYAKVFLSAGIADGKAALPYQSIYLTDKKQMKNDNPKSVLDYYYKRGIKPSEEPYKIPEDHIGVALSFMGLLCSELEESKDSKKILAEQKSFLDEHIVNWAYYLCGDILTYSETEFYKGLALVTEGLLKLDEKILAASDNQKGGSCDL